MRRVDDAELRRLWPTRIPDKELAALLGHHHGVIRRRAKALGLKPRREIWTNNQEGRNAVAMRCPSCKTGHTTVYDSRMAAGETVIRRRRKCVKCGHRFTTYEGSPDTIAVAARELETAE